MKNPAGMIAAILLIPLYSIHAQIIQEVYRAAIPDSLRSPAECGIKTAANTYPINLDGQYRWHLPAALDLSYSGNAAVRNSSNYRIGLQNLSLVDRKDIFSFAVTAGYGYDHAGIPGWYSDDSSYYDHSRSQRYSTSLLNTNNTRIAFDAALALSPSLMVVAALKDTFAFRKGFSHFESLWRETNYEPKHFFHYENHDDRSRFNIVSLSAGLFRRFDWPDHSPYMLLQCTGSSTYDNYNADTTPGISPVLTDTINAAIQKMFKGRIVRDNTVSLDFTYGEIYPEKTYRDATFRGGWLKCAGILEYVKIGYRLSRVDHNTQEFNSFSDLDTSYRADRTIIEKGYDQTFYYNNSLRLYLFRHFFLSWKANVAYHIHALENTNPSTTQSFYSFCPLGFGLTFISGKRYFFEVKSDVMDIGLQWPSPWSMYNYPDLFSYSRPSLGFQFLVLF
jgi:hypothetical protein